MKTKIINLFCQHYFVEVATRTTMFMDGPEYGEIHSEVTERCVKCDRVRVRPQLMITREAEDGYED